MKDEQKQIVTSEKTRSVGRPRQHDRDEVIAKLCEQLASSTWALGTCCERLPGFPAVGTLMAWIDASPKYQEQYARAKEAQAELLANQIVEIADATDALATLVEQVADSATDPKLARAILNAQVQRDRLRVEARKWVAAKLLPKRYGDHKQETVTHQAGGALEQALYAALKRSTEGTPPTERGDNTKEINDIAVLVHDEPPGGGV